MRATEERAVRYIGFERPATLEEIQFELLGLEYAVKLAETQIAILRQNYQMTVNNAKEAMAAKTKAAAEATKAGENKGVGKKEKSKK